MFLLAARGLPRGLWARPHWLTVRSWARLLPVVGLASVVLSACSVERTGVAGIGVDESGQLIGYIQMCDRHIDGATLYTSNDAKVPSQRVNVYLGEWEARDAVTDFARWRLLDPSEGWTALQTYVAPEGTAEFRLYGWTTDNSSSASRVTFRLSDISGLSPGEVLYGQGEKQVSTESDFRRAACGDED